MAQKIAAEPGRPSRRARRPRLLFWSSALALLLLPPILLIGWLRAPQLAVVGCELLRSDGSCLPFDSADEPLRLWLDVPAQAEVRILNGLTRVHPAEERQVDRGRVIILKAPLHPSLLSVHVYDGLFDWRWRFVDLTTRKQPQWLTEAWQEYNANHREAAKKKLQEHEHDSASAEARARMLMLSAQIAGEEAREDAPALLDKAIAASDDAGLASDALNGRLWRANLLTQKLALRDAEKVINDARPAFAKVPDIAPFEHVYRAQFAYLRGDLRSALLAAEEGRRLAKRTDNSRCLAELDQLGVMILALLGRLKDAEALLNEMDGRMLEPCRRFDRMKVRSWLHLRTADAQWADARFKKLKVPNDLFDAVEITRPSNSPDHCSQPRMAAQAMTAQAHLAAQAGNWAEVEKLVQAAQAQLGTAGAAALEIDDVEMTLDWRGLLADVALQNGALDKARELYRQLGEAGGGANFYDSGLRALIGRAQVEAASGNLDAARQLHEEAEQVLDRRSLAMPLGAGEGGHLGLYTRGTALYVDLLARMHEEDQVAHAADLRRAVAVVRHARVRALLGLIAMERLRRLDAAQRQHYETAIDAYGALRREIDAKRLKLDGMGSRERTAEAENFNRLNEQAKAKLEEAMGVVGASAAQLVRAATLRAVAPGEALFVCHPARTGWLCFVETADAIQAARLPQLDSNADREVLGHALLDPFASLLDADRVKKLRVVAYGAMREIDVHLLPFGPRRETLWQHIPVVYAADLHTISDREETSSDQANPQKKGFLLIDSEGRLPALNAAAQPIADSLQRAGYLVETHAQGVALVGDWAGKPKENVLHRADLIKRIEDATLFAHGSHFDFRPGGGLRNSIRLSEENGIEVSDVLLSMQRVPRYVALFGCNTARSEEELGDIEWLGFAQAFLSRGSRWAVGTVRTVGDELAADIAKRFFAQLGENSEPQLALRAAVLASGRQPVAHWDLIRPETDIGAIRVYEP